MPIRLTAAVPQFTVLDVVRTAEYYRDFLGFEVLGYWDGKGASAVGTTRSVFAIVTRDEVQVFFNLADRPDVRTGRARNTYDAYFHMVGIDALAGELSARGADIIDGPEDRVYKKRELVIRDCNGLILAFGEDTHHRTLTSNQHRASLRLPIF